jgi:hypothetical protein
MSVLALMSELASKHRRTRGLASNRRSEIRVAEDADGQNSCCAVISTRRTAWRKLVMFANTAFQGNWIVNEFKSHKQTDLVCIPGDHGSRQRIIF